MKTTSALTRERLLLAALLLLATVTYGNVWSRGAYADDFIHFSHVAGKPLWEAVQSWPEKLPSRVAQGLTVALVLSVFGGDSPAGFHWAWFHALAVLAFVLSVLVVDRILRVLDVPWRVRLVSCLVFVLHPAKSEALMWAGPITGYALPLLVFLFGVWRYFQRAREGREALPALIVVWCAVLYAVLSIEQFLPVFAAVVGVRLLLFGSTRVAVARNAAGFCAIAMAFVFSVAASGAGMAERFERHGFVDLPSLPKNLANVAFHSMAALTEYRAHVFFSSPLDRRMLVSSSGWLPLGSSCGSCGLARTQRSVGARWRPYWWAECWPWRRCPPSWWSGTTFRREGFTSRYSASARWPGGC